MARSFIDRVLWTRSLANSQLVSLEHPGSAHSTKGSSILVRFM